MIIVSIISVVFNARETFEDTILSVLKHCAGDKTEYIVIDGGSTDGTLDIVKRYANQLIWKSERDNGIYDAMNKGIKLANGRFIYFINNGDLLFELPMSLLSEICGADMVCFPIRIDNTRVKIPVLNFKFKLTNTLPHQGIFYLNQRCLSFDLDNRVFADYALNADYLKLKKNILLFRTPVIANHSTDGVSHSKNSHRELSKIILKKFGFRYLIFSKIYFKVRGLYYRFLLCF